MTRVDSYNIWRFMYDTHSLGAQEWRMRMRKLPATNACSQSKDVTYLL